MLLISIDPELVLVSRILDLKFPEDRFNDYRDLDLRIAAIYIPQKNRAKRKRVSTFARGIPDDFQIRYEITVVSILASL